MGFNYRCARDAMPILAKLPVIRNNWQKKQHAHYVLRNQKPLIICLKRLAKGDAEAWKMLNDHERRAIYNERNKTKLRFVKKFIWISDKQHCHIVGLRQDLAKNAKEKKRRKNARDTQRFRKRRRTRKMQAVLAEAQKMI